MSRATSGKKVIGLRSPQSVAWADAPASVIDSKMPRSYGCLKSAKMCRVRSKAFLFAKRNTPETGLGVQCNITVFIGGASVLSLTGGGLVTQGQGCVHVCACVSGCVFIRSGRCIAEITDSTLHQITFTKAAKWDSESLEQVAISVEGGQVSCLFDFK